MTELACANHPDVTNHVQKCRFCQKAVCQECRESQYLAGSIPALVCLDCVKLQQRDSKLQSAQRGLGIVALIVVGLGVLVSPFAWVLAIVLSLAFVFLSWRRIRLGIGSGWDFLNIGMLLRLFPSARRYFVAALGVGPVHGYSWI